VYPPSKEEGYEKELFYEDAEAVIDVPKGGEKITEAIVIPPVNDS